MSDAGGGTTASSESAHAATIIVPRRAHAIAQRQALLIQATHQKSEFQAFKMVVDELAKISSWPDLPGETV